MNESQANGEDPSAGVAPDPAHCSVARHPQGVEEACVADTSQRSISSSSDEWTDPRVHETFVVGEFHVSACPICLERFTLDNPAIIVPCKHGFHLQCLEAWRQRSADCPVCLEPLAGCAGRIMSVEDTRRRRRFRTATAPKMVVLEGGAPGCYGDLARWDQGRSETRRTVARDNACDSQLLVNPGQLLDEDRHTNLWKWIASWCATF